MPDLGFDYTVHRRPRRRSLSVQITPEGDVRVLVPKHIHASEVDYFVTEKRAWVLKHLADFELNHRSVSYEPGETFDYLGESYVLDVSEAADLPQIVEGTIRLPAKQVDKKGLKTVLHTWYRDRALDVISDRVELHAQLMGLSHGHVRVKSLRRRWGSCSSRRNLNFSWLLILTPLAVLDYVVVHECAHLVHMNHSAKFWALVERYCPDYKQHRSWLKAQQARLLSYLNE